MTEYIVDWDENLIIDTFSKNSLREEIVRCRDCAYYDEGRCYADKWSTASLLPAHRVASDGFCSWAERREP